MGYPHPSCIARKSDMRTEALILPLVLTLALPACSVLLESDRSSDRIRTEYLYQHWVHAYEEDPADAGEAQVYRPNDHQAFPPSRFRMQYVFERGGSCDWYYLAPTDGHHFRPGTWRLDPNDEAVLHIEQGEQTVSYRIIELTETLLRMKPLAVP